MVFKNKNAFTLALSLIIVPTSLVQASELLRDVFKKSERDKIRRAATISIPVEGQPTIPRQGQPTIPRPRKTHEIMNFLEVFQNDPLMSESEIEETLSGSASQAAAPMEEHRTTEEE